jgi:arylsulfatase A-like enzyme
VETLSVTPTVLGLFGVAPPYALDGPSLLEGVEREFARSFESRMALSLRSGSHRYWFRTTRGPWTRKDAPWRALAPWFLNRENLAAYADERPTTPEWLDLETADRRLKRDFRAEKAQVLKRIEASPKPDTIVDPEYREQLEKLGYLE